MSKAVGSGLLTLGAFGDVQWGESNHSLDALYIEISHRPASEYDTMSLNST
jgi:hypothetical protein